MQVVQLSATQVIVARLRRSLRQTRWQKQSAITFCAVGDGSEMCGVIRKRNVHMDIVRVYYSVAQDLFAEFVDIGFCISFCTSAATSSDVLRTVIRQSYGELLARVSNSQSTGPPWHPSSAQAAVNNQLCHPSTYVEPLRPQCCLDSGPHSARWRTGIRQQRTDSYRGRDSRLRLRVW